MTEDVVSALMSAADEEAWEKAGLFNPPATHLNTVHHSTQELFPLDMTLPPTSTSLVIKVYHHLQSLLRVSLHMHLLCV
jgi:hypothetical protein